MMSVLSLTKSKISAGIWQGVVTGSDRTPRLSVTHLNREVPGLTVMETKDDGAWLVQVPIPVEMVADGVQTLVMSEEETGYTLGKVSLIAGEPLEEDLRAEVDLLRAELDVLKRAFRRHCRESN